MKRSCRARLPWPAPRPCARGLYRRSGYQFWLSAWLPPQYMLAPLSIRPLRLCGSRTLRQLLAKRTNCRQRKLLSPPPYRSACRYRMPKRYWCVLVRAASRNAVILK